MLSFSSPAIYRPYYELMRLHQPTGILLLLWPAIWGILFTSNIIQYRLIILFSIGAIIVRAAGCIINDIVDSDIDRLVIRTANRPIASGSISIRQAILITFILLSTGLIILCQLPKLSIILGLISGIPIIIYPFMKRITFWPQLFLGLTFNLSALIGATSVTGTLPLGAVVLYISCAFWTIGYDTIYGHQDIIDDTKIGVKSTSILFGPSTKKWLIFFYSSFYIGLLIAGFFFHLNYKFYIGSLLILSHLIWQITSLNIYDPPNCKMIFRSNQWLGLIITILLLSSKFF